MKNVRFTYAVLAVFILTACGFEDDDTRPEINPNPNPPEMNNPPIRFLALGDSYTIGEAVDEDQRWPNQLAARLAEFDQPVSEVTFVARTGWTTTELDEAIAETELSPPYDLVSLLIGVNDQFRGFDVAAYRPRLETLLNQAIAFANGDASRVFLVSIPDYAYTPFGGGSMSISQGIDAYNAVKAQTANDYGVSYINITPISRRGIELPNLVAGDGLHPSGEQYRRWVEEEILRVVRELIRT
ncbi:MAG: SGNH/GDSL hydrolase family protein [Bacteroidota bacterium]